MTELHLPHGVTYRTHHDAHRVETIFPDGRIAHGQASFTPEDHARAQALGYGDDTDAVWHMHEEHDLCHHLVMQALGWPWSQVLWLVAHGHQQYPAGVYQTEERMAFLVARAANVGVRGLVA